SLDHRRLRLPLRDPAMSTIQESGEIDRDRRRFLGTAAWAVAAAKLGMAGPLPALAEEKGSAAARAPRASAAFGPLTQIEAGVLNVGYAESGAADGPAVLLLHGWPYDIHSFVDVAPLLASAGYRVIVPYLRGYGTTRFLASAAFRNGQPSAIA